VHKNSLWSLICNPRRSAEKPNSTISQSRNRAVSISRACPRLLAIFRHTSLDADQSKDGRLLTLTCPADTSDLRS
jgi:hypothetical protein